MLPRFGFRALCLVIALLPSFLVMPTAARADDWQTVRSSPGPSIQDICVLPDGLHGWAVGGSGAGGQVYSCVLRTTDGGANWTPLPTTQPWLASAKATPFRTTAVGSGKGSGVQFAPPSVVRSTQL